MHPPITSCTHIPITECTHLSPYASTYHPIIHTAITTWSHSSPHAPIHCHMHPSSSSHASTNHLINPPITLARVVAQRSRYCHITTVRASCTGLAVLQKLLQLLSRYCTTTSLCTLAQILPRYTLHTFVVHSGPPSSLTISAPLRETSIATSKSFSSTASHVWNKLPTHVSSALTLPVFRRHLKHHFYP